MKAMPLPFEAFHGEGFLLDFSPPPPSSSSASSASPSHYPHLFSQNHHQNYYHQHQQKWQSSSINNNNTKLENWCYVGCEPTSVLDTVRSPTCPPTPSSTLSSSQGPAGTGGSAAAVSGNPSTDHVSEKCGQQVGMEDWEGVLSGSPNQDQSILRLIMGDIEDPSPGLNKLLQGGNGSQDLDFDAGFGPAVDQVLGFDPLSCNNLATSIEPLMLSHNSTSPCNLLPGMFQQPQQQPKDEKKPRIVINQNQTHLAQNSADFLPFSYAQLQEQHPLLSPPLKRLNSGPFMDSRLELSMRRQQEQQQFQMLQHRPAMVKQEIPSNELGNQQLHQAILTNPICQAAELIDTRNPVLAQGILARLNHQLSLPIGKPYQRAAFYFKEALQLALHMNNTNATNSACNLILKIGAFKCFSELSPILHFANFTCNQALLEAFDGFDTIHVIDFDIGFGGHWASLMQELAMRNNGAPFLKITAFASSCSRDEVELGFTLENLRIFAAEINMRFELEILGLECLNSGSWPMPRGVSEKEVIAVNLPVGAFASYPTFFPLILRVVKQLSPKIVFSLDRGCDRNDLSFAHHVSHAIQSYSSMLESLDAVNMNSDTLQKIERFLIQPSIEKLVLGRYHCLDKIPTSRTLFLQAGFSPLPFSNLAESQAECLVQRIPVKGFHVEKRQSSLVLFWQRKELISASAWRC